MSKLAHAGYIAVVVLLLGLLLRFGAKDLLGWFMGMNGQGYVRVLRETDLVDPASGRIVGKLHAGIALRRPRIDDLDDTDLGDHDRVKLYFDLQNLAADDRELVPPRTDEPVYDLLELRVSNK
jgi:hypothetical protein